MLVRLGMRSWNETDSSMSKEADFHRLWIWAPNIAAHTGSRSRQEFKNIWPSIPLATPDTLVGRHVASCLAVYVSVCPLQTPPTDAMSPSVAIIDESDRWLASRISTKSSARP